MARWRVPVGIALFMLAVGTFLPAAHYEPLTIGDPAAVSANPHVLQGLTGDGVKWAFQSGPDHPWHPLTWLSLMLDRSLSRSAGGMHLTNILLHALNTIAVFWVLQSLTGAFWRSTVVAALFAVHPLQVEAVAWIAERQTLLAVFFALLSLWAYQRYAARGRDAARRGPLRSIEYGLALAFFALGLMSDITVVVLPVLMLLLDYWPLKRVSGFGIGQLETRNEKPGTLLLEKLPFAVLAIVLACIAFPTWETGAETLSLSDFPPAMRMESAAIACAHYLAKIFWPAPLAVAYSHPDTWPAAQLALAAAIIIAGCAAALGMARRRPWLLVGWFWFLIALAPAIATGDSGFNFMADRFGYFSLTGLLIVGAWGAEELTRNRGMRRMILSIAGSAAVIAAVAVTRVQLGYWSGSESLLRHAIASTRNNDLAHYHLGLILARQNRLEEAAGEFREALQGKPAYPEVYNDLGVVLTRQNLAEEAVKAFIQALALRPTYVEAHYNLGVALAAQGRLDEAISQYRETLGMKPDYPEAHYDLGLALLRKGNTAEAAHQFREVLRLRPDYADAKKRLDSILPESEFTKTGRPLKR